VPPQKTQYFPQTHVAVFIQVCTFEGYQGLKK